MLLRPNPVGHHTTLTPQKIDEIIAAVPEVIVQNQVAHRAHVTKQSLSQWLEQGQNDIEKGRPDSLFAQLYDRFHKARSEIVKNTLATLLGCPKNFQALTWTLEKCFREDFGKDSEQIQKLLDLVFNQVIPLAQKGVLQNGSQKAQEVDTENAHEERRLT